VDAQTNHATEFRGKQREQWNTAATGWQKWSEYIDRTARPVSRRLVELAGIEEGDRVLDVAAGYGEPSLTAARAVGPGGEVVATDISREMLAFGRERAGGAGIENIEFVESDASSLEFPAETFDAAVSRWGIIFEPDGEGAAARVRGFLKAGARMAISSWGPPERVPFLSVPLGTVMRKLDVPPPPPGTPGPMSRPTADALGGLLEGGGFSDVSVEEIVVPWEFESPEEATAYTRDIAAPIGLMLAPHPAEVQEEAWAEVTTAFREHAVEGGRVRLPSVTLLAAGRA
jgi:SAM-dependent methyltransferase